MPLSPPRLRTFLVATSTLATTTLATPTHAQQLAFPTAEGFGKFAQGGRGGDVYLVENLNDSGAGSLRACVEAAGPRTCVFRVSGEIKTQSRIRATHPYLTIAGQTAPGDGIVLTNRGGPNPDSPMLIATHDVIVRHIRFRPGPSQKVSSNVDALLITGHDVILDHVTMSWATDETLNIAGNSGTSGRAMKENAHSITVQWSMIYETLRNSTHPSSNHSRSTYIAYGARDITFHHNLIANNQRRNPNFGTIGQTDFVNNVVYNSQEYFGEVYNRHGTPYLNWVGNLAVAGPNTPNRLNMHALNFFKNDGVASFEVFLHDNLDVNRTDTSLPETLVIDPKDLKYTRSSPVGYGELSLAPSLVTGPQQAWRDVLSFAGAAPRDTADARVVSEIRGCRGAIIDDPSQVGGWPILTSTSAPQDSDRDGMPDTWERNKNLDPQNPDDRNDDANGDGYTNLEEYLAELAGDNDGFLQGGGVGADADTRCGRSFRSVADVSIDRFTVSPASVKPGEAVTLTWNSTGAESCKFSWTRNIAPTTFDGVDVLVVNDTTPLGLSCTRDNVDDWVTHVVFATADGAVPKPNVSLNADKQDVSVGDEIVLKWVAGEPRNTNANECIASGLWNGFRSVIGAETVTATSSGEYVLTCNGPGGSDEARISVTVAGTPPPTPVPPAPSPSPTPAPAPAPAPALPSLSVFANNQSMPEGNSGQTPFNFTVSRTGDLSVNSSASYQVGGTVDGADFGGGVPAGVVTFTANESTQLITVNVSGDTTVEDDETLVVSLTNPVNAELSTPNAVSTISNDDAAAPPPQPTPAPTPKPTPTPSPSPTPDDVVTPDSFEIGAAVIAIRHARVRRSPAGAAIGRNRRGTKGVIVDGPVVARRKTWWKVNFEGRKDGWVRENFLDTQTSGSSREGAGDSPDRSRKSRG